MSILAVKGDSLDEHPAGSVGFNANHPDPVGPVGAAENSADRRKVR
ncbi:MAG: hypothetical protein BroJett011_14110 [Chloroflexota bacterium]|nr:MAG: hypothetical protein BroJett011_14110 [Chloroflexota bacterium]